MKTKNAPAPTEAQDLQYQMIAIDDITPNPANPRRIDDDHPSLIELAESIKNTGLINPITVRPAADGFELLAGERRWRAAKLSGATSIACHIVKVSDEQAFDILTVENLQRQDLTWLEEANGVQAMLEHGRDAETIAKSIGRSPSWVALRAKLSTLSDKWKKEAAAPKRDKWDDSKISSWPAGMLELVARMPKAVQEEMLDDWSIKECETVADLKQEIDSKYLHLLSAAAWSLDDTKLLPRAGACSACPKRSSCQLNLFETQKGDTCTDVECWDAKADAFIKRSTADLQKAHPNLVLMKMDYQDKTKGAVSQHDVKVVKQGAKGARPTLITSGDGKGSLVYTVPLTKYDPSSSSGERKVSKASQKGSSKTVAERVEALQKRRDKHVCELFVKWFHGIADELPVPMSAEQMMALASTVGTAHDLYHSDDIAKAIKDAAKVKADRAPTELWIQLHEVLLNLVRASTQRGDAPIAAVKAICGLDVSWTVKLPDWIAAAEKEVPTPKALVEDLKAKGKKG